MGEEDFGVRFKGEGSENVRLKGGTQIHHCYCLVAGRRDQSNKYRILIHEASCKLLLLIVTLTKYGWYASFLLNVFKARIPPSQRMMLF